jgi:hypothetical protein
MSNARLLQEIRASALAGSRSAFRMIAFSLLWLPIGTAINLIFDGKARTDWKISLEVGGTIAILWYGVSFFSTLRDLRKESRIAVAKNPRFSATAFVSGLYGATAIFSLWLTRGLHAEGDPLWLQLLPLVFLGAVLYAWPRPIHCDDQSIWQRGRWGRKKSIRYQDIQSISLSCAGGTTTVLGPRAMLEHTSQHVDPESFRRLVSLRSGKPIY